MADQGGGEPKPLAVALMRHGGLYAELFDIQAGAYS